jgi:predicted Zn-dependent protease
MRYIYLQPIGEVDRAILEGLADKLEERFRIPHRTAPCLEMPKEAYHPGRRQYHSTTILRLIKKKR